MTITDTPAPDLTQVKARQQQMWASGDFHLVATLRSSRSRTPSATPSTCRPRWRVLDVACGSGNAALAAARCGADVVGIDYVRLCSSAAGVVPRWKGSRSTCSRPTRSRSPSRTASSTPCCRSSARCSRRTSSGRRRAWPVCRPGGRSASSPGHRTGSWRGAQGRCRARAAAGGRRLSPALGNRVAPARALRRHRRQPRVHGADVHVALPLGRGVRRLLPHLLRPDVQGVRSRRRGWSRRALLRPGRSDRPARARTPARSRSPRRGWRRSPCAAATAEGVDVGRRRRPTRACLRRRSGRPGQYVVDEGQHGRMRGISR